jgi:hypothetical protein
VIAELGRRFPKASPSQRIWLPVIRAAAEISQGNPENALQS